MTLEENTGDKELDASGDENRGEYIRKSSVIRELIRHENEICHHRMYWLVIIEGLLFASLGTVLKNDFFINIKYLIFVFAFTGIFVSVSFGYIFHLSEIGFSNLKNIFNKYNSHYQITDDVDFEIISAVNHDQMHNKCQRCKKINAILHFLSPWKAMPILFFISWTIIIIIFYIYPVADKSPLLK